MSRPNRLAVALAALLFVPAMASCTRTTADEPPIQTGDAPVSPPSAEVPPPEEDGPPLPVGQRDGWELTFSDEFDGTALDTKRWADRSSAEPDMGHGNPGNQQLEWNQAANCKVTGDELVMTAKRQAYTAPSGTKYGWTSCLITSTPSYDFQYGYIEERSILPPERGFWPAFWTWQARGVDQHTETDVYEFYSDNHQRLYGTQYSGPRARCDLKPTFNPTDGWHTYGAAIEPSGTTWFLDGRQVCTSRATSDGSTNIVSNLAVYSKIPPDDTVSSATKRVDYIRAWQRPS